MQIPCGLQLTDPQFNHNLAILLQRKRGDKFIVKDGRLHVINGVFEHLHYLFDRTSMQRQVQRMIGQTLNGVVLEEERRTVIEALFFKVLKPLGASVYDRGQLSEEIENFLSPTLKTQKEAFKENENELVEYALKVEKVRLAVNLGVDFSPIAEGCNGTYFGRDRFGKKLVVFKPADEQGVSDNNPRLSSRIKKLLLSFFDEASRPHSNISQRNSYLYEIGAATVDRALGTRVVPLTKLQDFQSSAFSSDKGVKRGSCQLFSKGVMADTVYHSPKFAFSFLMKLFFKLFEGSMPRSISDESFEKFAILDFLIGNQDRHFANFLIDGNQAIAIDNGLSFPSKKPASHLSDRNQYLWGYLPQAQIPFSAFGKELALKLKDAEFVDSLFQTLASDMADGAVMAFEPEIKQEMLQRIDIFVRVVEQNKTIAYLSEIKRDEDYDRAHAELALAKR